MVARDELQRMKHYHDMRRKNADAAPKRYKFRFKTKEGRIKKGWAAIDTIKGTEKTVASVIDITDQEKTRFELERRLEFERAMAKISSRFVATADIDEAINLTLRDIGQLSGASRSYLFLIQEDGPVKNTHQWCAPGIESQSESLANIGLPLLTEKLKDTKNPKDLDISELWQQAGANGNKDALFTGSLLILPIVGEGEVVGFAEFDNVKKATEWSEEDRAVLSTVCNMIGIALERKWTHEEIEKYSHHLEDLVEERTRQLKKKERMAAIGQTTAMVGHDLRNPLQVVVNNIYLAKKAIDQGNPGDVLERLKVIEHRASYMNKIVSDLQDFSRPIKPELRPVDLPSLILDALDGIEIPGNVEVKTDFKDGPEEFEADPNMIRRILINLVTNAVQAMPDGGQLDLSISFDESNSYLRIKDTGMGISDESMGNIFDPMYSTKAQGQGFGLPVCKKLAEAHGGNISVQSTEQKGTTFTLTLPRN